jgi:hypothetical protein
MSARNRFFILLGIIFVIAAAYYFFSTNHTSDLVLIGTVDANQVIVSAQVAGRIQKLLVDEGTPVKAGDLIVYREVKGGEGFGATNPYRQHFGLGKALKIDSLEIRWPSGTTHKFTALDANHIVALKEDEREWRRIQ